MENQKTIHTIRGQGWAAECIDQPPDTWAVDKFWIYIELEHSQGSDTASLYPANIGMVGHGLLAYSQVQEIVTI